MTRLTSRNHATTVMMRAASRVMLACWVTIWLIDDYKK